MSRFLVGSVLLTIAMLAVFGTGVTNTVVNWFDNLGNSSSEEVADTSVAIAAADDLTPIQRAGRLVQSQTEPFAGGAATLFAPGEEIAQGQGGAAPEGAPASLAAQPTATPAATDSSIPALW